MATGNAATLVVAGLLAALGMVACKRNVNADDPPVARAYDQYLRWSDLRKAIPMGLAATDSADLARRYINEWISQRVIVHQAEANLPPAELDFEARLQEYRLSLVRYAYERAVVDQLLDTTISDADIQAYFKENPANFGLKDNIVRVRWFKVRETDKRVLKRLDSWFRSKTPDDLHQLELWLAQHRVEMHDTGADWILFSDLQKDVPVHTSNPTDLLNRQGDLVVKDSVNTYFVAILEHRFKDADPPMSLVRNDIKAILLNRRKLQLIERMQEDLIRHAWERKDIEVL
ncbi:MAG: hypothetical protein JNM31_07555 [Flavobacteriales bacterium]|nr:hypothetical protein [Flavobacteriales bacterium]